MAFHKKEEFTVKEQELAAFAKAMSHPARIAILKILAQRNECICGEIVDVLPLAQSTVSQHLKELKEAVDQFDGGQPMSGDIVFNGNIGRWKRFANSLRAQIALRMSKVYPNAGGLAATEFASAIAHPAGTISSNEDNLRNNISINARVIEKNENYRHYVETKNIKQKLSMIKGKVKSLVMSNY